MPSITPLACHVPGCDHFEQAIDGETANTQLTLHFKRAHEDAPPEDPIRSPFFYDSASPSKLPADTLTLPIAVARAAQIADRHKHVGGCPVPNCTSRVSSWHAGSLAVHLGRH